MATVPPLSITPDRALEIFGRAAQLNRDDPLRDGSLINLPEYGQCVMTGDLHGHRGNFAKLLRFAALDRMPHRHVILHELIHEDVMPGGADRSWQLCYEAAALKCEYPEQVHFLQSNHELAQIVGQHISKGGRDVIEDFNTGVLMDFGPARGREVLDALTAFMESYPLAARAPNRVWISHSLPNERERARFDPQIVKKREHTVADRTDGGSVYQLVWGRHHPPALLEALGRAWDVDFFLIGHQPQEMGFEVMHDRLIIFSSEHSHGAFLPFDLSRPPTIESLSANIRKFVEVA